MCDESPPFHTAGLGDRAAGQGGQAAGSRGSAAALAGRADDDWAGARSSSTRRPRWDRVGILRAARRRIDASQRDLAAMVGVSASTIERAELPHGPASLWLVEAILTRADLRLAVLDRQGREVVPEPTDVTRDGGGRRYPAHLDVWPISSLDHARGGPRYDRPPSRATYEHVPHRDARRRRLRCIPSRHPTAPEMIFWSFPLSARRQLIADRGTPPFILEWVPVPEPDPDDLVEGFRWPRPGPSDLGIPGQRHTSNAEEDARPAGPRRSHEGDEGDMPKADSGERWATFLDAISHLPPSGPAPDIDDVPDDLDLDLDPDEDVDARGAMQRGAEPRPGPDRGPDLRPGRDSGPGQDGETGENAQPCENAEPRENAEARASAESRKNTEPRQNAEARENAEPGEGAESGENREPSRKADSAESSTPDPANQGAAAPGSECSSRLTWERIEEQGRPETLPRDCQARRIGGRVPSSPKCSEPSTPAACPALGSDTAPLGDAVSEPGEGG